MEPPSQSPLMQPSDSLYLAVAEEDFHCGICCQVYHRPVCCLPCLHHFCAGCFGRWMERANLCPLCRAEVTEIHLDRDLAIQVDAYLATNPQGKRSPQELSALDEYDTLEGDSRRVEAPAWPPGFDSASPGSPFALTGAGQQEPHPLFFYFTLCCAGFLLFTMLPLEIALHFSGWSASSDLVAGLWKTCFVKDVSPAQQCWALGGAMASDPDLWVARVSLICATALLLVVPCTVFLLRQHPWLPLWLLVLHSLFTILTSALWLPVHFQFLAPGNYRLSWGWMVATVVAAMSLTLTWIVFDVTLRQHLRWLAHQHHASPSHALHPASPPLPTAPDSVPTTSPSSPVNGTNGSTSAV
eukprot:EG_transcript_10530